MTPAPVEPPPFPGDAGNVRIERNLFLKGTLYQLQPDDTWLALSNLIAKLWSDTAQFATEMGGQLKKATVAFEVSPPMLGVGYIIGPKVAANMFSGGLLAFMVLIPLIVMFGGAQVAAMSPSEIRHDYVLYIGAGAVAAGGFISLGRSTKFVPRGSSRNNRRRRPGRP